MLLQIAILLVSALTVNAGSIRRHCHTGPPGPPGPPTAGGPLDPRSKELAGPEPLGFKSVLIGHGIQNYTCPAAGAKATATGALAVLWDIAPLFPGSGPLALSTEAWAALTVKALHTTAIPLNLAADAGRPYAADPSAPFPAAADLTLEGVRVPLRFAGHHYFAGSVPTFTMGDALFVGKKNDGIAAPADADNGITGTGTIDWLRLGDTGSSHVTTLAYRVYTAGGVAGPCTGAGQAESVPYTAQYWFFG
ncbi:uncharacterized protein B0I36DRAFT_378518 [Microdochium trichocladiopsis]|uniref:Malate dehydrogenase n=1 Tax=Microdochium trichocladiopsis TaxID=1682393 RepID=A0A9P8XQH5_9PEZI|nr:uncharacterized protein B0I36DRAFT_378518 [Microdochium trichocladiopsis]KAH7010858.1 hypothetical protein B0I36DRAFT_378518 [Microdochium trichocladiopsis]